MSGELASGYLTRLLADHGTLLNKILGKESAHQVPDNEASYDTTEEGTHCQGHHDLGVIPGHNQFLVFPKSLELKHAFFLVLFLLLPQVGLKTGLVLFGLFVPHLFVDGLPNYFLIFFVVIFASPFVFFVQNLCVLFRFFIY